MSNISLDKLESMLKVFKNLKNDEKNQSYNHRLINIIAMETFKELSLNTSNEE